MTLSLNLTNDAAINQAISRSLNDEEEIQAMFDSASVPHKEITQQPVNPWIFSGSLINTDIQDHIPEKLSTFICWVIEGPGSSLQTSSHEMLVLYNCYDYNTEYSVCLQE